jgi:hypothetical protein
VRKTLTYSQVLGIAACLISALAFVPGIPAAPFLILAGITGFMAYMLKKHFKTPAAIGKSVSAEVAALVGALVGLFVGAILVFYSFDLNHVEKPEEIMRILMLASPFGIIGAIIGLAKRR